MQPPNDSIARILPDNLACPPKNNRYDKQTLDFRSCARVCFHWAAIAGRGALRKRKQHERHVALHKLGDGGDGDSGRRGCGISR